MRAAVYCRISQDKTGEGLGVTRQQEDCVELAQRLGWTVTEVYADNDISATSGKPRPAYRRMLEGIKSGEIQALVAWHPDRLYRRLADLEELIPVVEDGAVAIATVRAGDFDLATPTGRMIARILASVATGEVEVKADRWIRSVRQRREAGRMPRSRARMFGWTREGRVVEDEAEVIRFMVAEVLAGTTLGALARRLDERGVLTTMGNPWSLGSIRGLLLNPRLAGYSVLNGEIVGTGEWTPILEITEWETVRAVLTSRVRVPKPRVALLAGLVYCASCGQKMVTGGRPAGAKGKPRVRVYRCDRRLRLGCNKNVTAAAVEELVESFAKARFRDPRVGDNVVRLKADPGVGELAREAAALELRIVELTASLAEPGVPVPTILRAIDKTKERQAELQGALAAAVAVDVIPGSTGVEWPEDLHRRRRLVDVFVERVVVAPAERPGAAFDPARVTIEERWA